MTSKPTRAASSRRSCARALVLVLPLLAPLASGCSAKHDPQPGEIFLAIDTNLKFPDDIDTIGISIKNDVGILSEDAMFPLGTGDGAQFPATFAIVRGTTGPVTIRAVGYKGQTPITVREVVTTLPANRTALLHMDLDFLNSGMVTATANSTLVSQLTITCAAGTTPIGGQCGAAITLDSVTLPDYQASDLGNSAAASAVDIDACYVGGSSVAPASSSITGCTVPLPSVTSNFGLLLPAGSGAGWCSGSSCVVPLQDLDGDGWFLEADGVVHLPLGVCAKGTAVFTTPVTAACPLFSLQHPAFQNYAGTASDAGTPIVDSAAPVDGSSSTGAIVSLARSNLTTFAVDDSSVYLMSGDAEEGTSLVERIPLLFSGAQPAGTMTPLPFTAATGASSVRFPQFAFVTTVGAFNGAVSANLLDAGSHAFSNPAQNGVVDPAAIALVPSSDGGTTLAYVVNSVGAFLVDPTSSITDAGPFDPRGITLGGGPTSDGGTLLAIAQGAGQAITSGLASAQSPVLFGLETDPQEVVPTADGRVFWKDQNGSLWVSDGADGGATLATGALPSTSGQTLGSAGNQVFWLDSNNALNRGVLGAASITSTSKVTYGSNVPVTTTHFLVRSGMIFWIDGFGVSRLPVPSTN